MSIQVIKKKRKADYVIIPYNEFLKYADVPSSIAEELKTA